MLLRYLAKLIVVVMIVIINAEAHIYSIIVNGL